MSYIQQRRMGLGLSQSAVARAAGMSRSQYQRVEQGLVLASPDQAQALERTLGIAMLSTAHLVRSADADVAVVSGVVVHGPIEDHVEIREAWATLGGDGRRHPLPLR